MKKLILTVIFFLMCAPLAYAVPLDLSLVSSPAGTIAGATFARTALSGQGTGNFQSFLRIQANGTEKGYNTDGSIEFDTKPGLWTSSLLLSDVPLVTVGDVAYREFLLDAGEPSGNSLFLTKMDIYLLGSGSISGYNTTNFPLSSRIYTMVDSSYDSILLDNITGNGFSDMFAYVPDSLFYGNNQYVYLYSEFEQSGGTFEEWGVRGAANTIPEPMTAMLFGAGMIGLVFRKKKI